MPAPALESAQAALQGVQVQMTRRGRDEAETGGWEGGKGGVVYVGLAAGSSASNEGLKGSTRSDLNRVDCTA